MNGFIPEQPQGPGPIEAEINRRLREGDGSLSFDPVAAYTRGLDAYAAQKDEDEEFEELYREIVRGLLIRLAIQYSVVLGVRYLATRATKRSFWTLEKRKEV